jgi:Flp pilus assembly protein TadG
VVDRRSRGDRASAVVFVPAAVLILLMLGALAVDLTVAYLARHQLDDAAASAANDAVTAGLDLAAFDADGRYQLDEARVDAVVLHALAARHDPVVDRAIAEQTISVDVVQNGDPTRPVQVTVTIRSRADLVFMKAVPGLSSTMGVTATATATAVVGP